MSSFQEPMKERRVAGVLSVLLAAVTGALGLLNWLILRGFVLLMLPVLQINPWSWRAIENFSFLLLGMGWLVLVLYSQYYYYKGAGRRRMWHNFGVVSGFQLQLLSICLIIPLLLGIGNVSIESWLLALAPLIAGILLVAVWVKNGRKRGSPPDLRLNG